MLGAATATALSFTAPARADTATETVVVTGSRIPQVGIYSSSPVTALGDHELKLEGTTSVSGALQTLPSVVNDGDGDSVDNGTAGIATVDLRNLGAKRTLVLVDGKRLVAADASLDVDTNQIPATMVERIEVLTGGASAVYGSDAVAGVVNIILKKDFEGMTVDSQFSETDRSDGEKNDTSLLLGVNSADGKGNVTVYAEYAHRDPVLGAARDFSAHALAVTNYTGGCQGLPTVRPDAAGNGFCFSGSSTIPEGRIKSLSLGGPTAGQGIEFQPGGTIKAYTNETFNFAPYQYLQTEGQRYAFGGTAHYQITPGIDFYSRLTFSDNSSTSQLGPSPLTTNFNINCGNPEMSEAVRQAIFGTTPNGIDTAAGIRAQCTTAATGNNITANADPAFTTRLVSTALRLTQDGPRISINDHQAYQLVLGARGGLGYGWNYDVSAQYGHTDATTILENDALKGNFQNGLLVSPDTGLCTQDSANCSPLNFFTDQGLTAANVNYIRENLLLIQTVDQWDVQGTVTGDLGFAGIQSPWAKEPVGLAAGVEYRQEEAHATPDNNLATGNLVGFQSAAPTGGGFDVGEGYFEVRAPLIEDVPFIESLSFNGAYRYDHYNTAGDANSYNIGIEWQPIDDIRFRGGYQQAIRAPNVSELFTPTGGSSANAGQDPCSNAGAIAGLTAGQQTAVQGLCVATGVPTGTESTTAGRASLDCPSSQCQAATGGNPFLKPETSDSWTLGLVLTPTFIPGLTATVDYYNIKIGGFITATPISSILNNCYNPNINTTLSAAATACSFIHRDALGSITTQNLGYVIAAEGNIGGDKVQGFDTEINYDLDLNDMGWAKAGSLSFNFVSTLVTVNNTTLADGTVLHCAGTYGTNCGEPQNRFRSNLRTTWTDDKGDFSISLRWRFLTGIQSDLYQDGYSDSVCTTGGSLAACAPAAIATGHVLRWGDYSYFDISGTWSVTDGIDLRAGVRNLLDKDPPLTDNNSAPASDINNNTFPNTYDALGRVIFVGATVKL
ncbi:MAG TPA: TonB-dependent receptor [Rhizomicrobium sp.]|jgi:outer membrane receptor protein involved in Fe transport|nr:TonB-dependent receptor [Rhizomicrobium sp.]